MLQLGHTAKIERFYADLEALDLKAPVADISRKTGESKGNVSKIVRRLKEPSDSFLERFYKSYLNVSHETGHGTQVAGAVILGSQGVSVTLQDYLELQKEMITRLSEDKERLFSLLNSSLVRISDDQQIALAYQKAWVEYEAEKSAKGDPKKKREIISHMGKLVDGKLMGDVKEDKNPDLGR
jgi:hypothetical protein